MISQNNLLILVMLPPVFRVFIGSKVLFLCVDCECSTSCDSYRIIFKFGIMVLYDKSKKPIEFGDAAPNVPYCIVSKVILLSMVCERSTGCNSYRLIFKFVMKVHHDKAKKLINIGGAASSCSRLYRVKGHIVDVTYICMLALAALFLKGSFKIWYGGDLTTSQNCC